jgi:hypothetical protein
MERESLLAGQAFLVRGFFSPAECEEHIDLAEELGFDDAPINMDGGAVIMKDYRNNSRVISDDPDLAAQLYPRLHPHLPDRIGGRTVSGLNERFRYYRYDVQEAFAPHYDGPYRRNDYEESELTFMVYLNDDFEWGEPFT